GHQQLLATEDVQRQKAPIAIVAVEMASLLMPMHPVVGRIEVENQLRGRLLEGGDELLDQDLMESRGCLAIHPLFQPAECGIAGQCIGPIQSRLPREIPPQCVVIVEILVPKGQTVDALAQQIDLAMGNQQWISRIGQHRVQSFDQPESSISLPQQKNPTVTRDISSGEIRFNLPAIKAWKTQFSLRTLWH